MVTFKKVALYLFFVCGGVTVLAICFPPTNGFLFFSKDITDAIIGSTILTGILSAVVRFALPDLPPKEVG